MQWQKLSLDQNLLMWIRDSSRINLAAIRGCTSTNVPSCSWWGAHALTVCIWLLVSSSPVLWTECPFVTGVSWVQFWSLASAFLASERDLVCMSQDCSASVIQSILSADGWDNLLWELLLIWGTTLIFSQPLYIVLLLLSYHTLQNFCYKSVTEGMAD